MGNDLNNLNQLDLNQIHRELIISKKCIEIVFQTQLRLSGLGQNSNGQNLAVHVSFCNLPPLIDKLL